MIQSGSVGLLAFVTALVVAGLVMRAGILDHPNARSSHVRPTPRGGGLGIVVGFLFSLALIPLPAPADQAMLGGLALCAVLTALLGFVDDLVSLDGRIKFAVLATISLALAGMAGPVTDLGFALPWLAGWLGSALFVFTLANAVNFMDGSDGLLASTLIPAALALGVLADGPVAVAALALAAATAGFAVWNAPLLAARGRLFSGDVGALGGAVIFAGLSLAWASTDRGGSVWLVPLLVLPLLGDVLLTMAARVRAGRSAFAAHRAHAYQLLISIGLSHRQVAMIWGGMSLSCGVLAIVASALPSHLQLACLVVAVVIFTLGHRRCRKLASSHGLDIHQ
ncbi:glycosyltransferase family 4 protein [Maricaulis sp.]|uniref:glycosyltransferase family 4 protein n=1 Tax=Maricaulis sp. TaxID=1486257 RepID=UPI003A956006